MLLLRKAVRQLLLISSNILDISLVLLAIADCLRRPERAVRKQFTAFSTKTFKITKVEGNIFYGWGWHNEQMRVFSRSSHPEVFCKKSVLKYSAKLTGKQLCRSLSLACWRETLLKKETPDHHVQLCRKYLKFLCMKQSENVFKRYCLGKLFLSNIFSING